MLISNWFDSLIDKYFRQTVYQRYANTLEHLKNSEIETVLDIGCGPAETVEHFSDVEYIGFFTNYNNTKALVVTYVESREIEGAMLYSPIYIGCRLE